MAGTGSRGKRSFSSSLSSWSSSLSSSSSSSCVSLQLKEDDKFFSKLLSREDSSSADRFSKLSSCSLSKALYYGGSQGSIPFTWESRPGTPKNPSFYPIVGDIVPSPIPPLTPPPSSYSSSSSSLSAVPIKNFLRRKQHNLSLSGMVSRVKSTSGSAGGSPRTRSHTLSLSTSPWTLSGSGSASHSLVSTNSRFSVEQRHSRSRFRSGFLPDVGTESIHVDNSSSSNYNNSSRGGVGGGKKIDRTHRSPDSTLKFSSRRKHRSSVNRFWACGPVAKVKRVIFSIVGQSSTSRQDAAK